LLRLFAFGQPADFAQEQDHASGHTPPCTPDGDGRLKNLGRGGHGRRATRRRWLPLVAMLTSTVRNASNSKSETSRQIPKPSRISLRNHVVVAEFKLVDEEDMIAQTNEPDQVGELHA
jgi:hypothetical protein